MNDTRLCKDCKHSLQDSPHPENWKCLRAETEDSKVMVLLIGKNDDRKFFNCTTERKYHVTGGCGPEGANYEPRE